jgi:apolipoprotein D and lipocalin family protein
MKKVFLVLLLICLNCFADDADKYPSVTGFDINRYLGTWYEIARFDHSFQKDLDKVSAEYSLRDDGGMKVINRGLNSKTNKWEQAEGKAYFVKTPDIGRLKVSFFWPFYGAYNIIALDKNNYEWAMVTGGKDYLWIIARSPQMPYIIKQQLIARAKEMGFDTDKLIYDHH